MSSNTISLNAPDHPIKAVTVFQSSAAQLTRTFSVDLKASTRTRRDRGGSNVLEIARIPNHIDKESPRIYGLGTDARVSDILCSTRLAYPPLQNHTKNAGAAKKLALKRKLLQAERDVVRPLRARREGREGGHRRALAGLERRWRFERQDAKVHWTRAENGGGGEKEGLDEWVCELKAGEKVRLEAKWEVKAPSSLRWEEQLNTQFARGKGE
ncbi:hypothetical protein V8D89_001681 [Ganoderma adspersum]